MRSFEASCLLLYQPAIFSFNANYNYSFKNCFFYVVILFHSLILFVSTDLQPHLHTLSYLILYFCFIWHLATSSSSSCSSMSKNSFERYGEIISGRYWVKRITYVEWKKVWTPLSFDVNYSSLLSPLLKYSLHISLMCRQ